jgi:hypothetical protein
MCIVRACKGSKKISTVVRAEDLAKFHESFSNILKVRVFAYERAWLDARVAVRVSSE